MSYKFLDRDREARLATDRLQVSPGDQRKLIWRSWRFFGSSWYQDLDGTSPGHRFYSATKMPRIEWVQHCLTDIAALGLGPRRLPKDIGVYGPYEIHLIEDPDAYAAALDAFFSSMKTGS